MALRDIVFRVLDKAGVAFIEPRREDGHGSAIGTPSFISAAEILPTSDSTDVEWISRATTVTNAGDTVIYTPAPGKRIRLHWIYAINDPVSSSSTKITVKIGGTTYYVAWALSKRQQFTGPVDGVLTINLSSPGDVAVTAFLEEI